MIRPSVFAAGLLWVGSAIAGYQAGAADNIAIYWGQNSAGVSDTGKSQKTLSEYCANTAVDIIPIAFLSSFSPVEVSLSNMQQDSNIGQEIISCQKAGKTIMLSIGGATFTSGPSSAQDAQSLADQVWSMFGPANGTTNSSTRPFGDAVVDGFDLDIEAPLPNMTPFAARLRQHLDTANAGGGKTFYLSAAPQCPYPDQNNKDIMLGNNAVSFDFVMVQFYNNPTCDVRVFGSNSDPSKSGFNMAVWDKWAQSSKNPNVKIFLGIPGGPSAVTPSQEASYKTPDKLVPIIAYSKSFKSFGGIMIWDMSQVYSNEGFLDAISNGIKCPPGGSPNTSTHVNADQNEHHSESGSANKNTHAHGDARAKADMSRQSNRASSTTARTHQRNWKP
ncbi:glycoside hydrolase family 18 protein [Hypoxylon sp. FL1150]|nr:glycoside hydrolase family 18 protein [Hypoxylon sp. FL1150]